MTTETLEIHSDIFTGGKIDVPITGINLIYGHNASGKTTISTRLEFDYMNSKNDTKRSNYYNDEGEKKKIKKDFIEKYSFLETPVIYNVDHCNHYKISQAYAPYCFLDTKNAQENTKDKDTKYLELLSATFSFLGRFNEAYEFFATSYALHVTYNAEEVQKILQTYQQDHYDKFTLFFYRNLSYDKKDITNLHLNNILNVLKEFHDLYSKRKHNSDEINNCLKKLFDARKEFYDATKYLELLKEKTSLLKVPDVNEYIKKMMPNVSVQLEPIINTCATNASLMYLLSPTSQGIDGNYTATNYRFFHSLSESERTNIAFALFLHEWDCTLYMLKKENEIIKKYNDEEKKNDEEEKPLKKMLICIDDPISSFDENKIYTMFSLIRQKLQETKDAGLLDGCVILTHNHYFARLCAKLGSVTKHILKNGTRKQVNEPNRIFDSEYAMLCYYVNEFRKPRDFQSKKSDDNTYCQCKKSKDDKDFQSKKSGNNTDYQILTMGNIIRRTWEAFLKFKLNNTNITNQFDTILGWKELYHNKKETVRQFLNLGSHQEVLSSVPANEQIIDEMIDGMLELIKVIDPIHHKHYFPDQICEKVENEKNKKNA